MPPRTRPVHDSGDIRAFFDGIAADYRDTHGRGDRPLRYRLGLIARLLEGLPTGSLLEIGCGTGLHLFPLADRFERAVGVDLSPAMIAAADRIRQAHPARARIELAVDRAEELASVDDSSMDVVLCVGALEHMPDRPAVLRQVRRVLRRGGAFICLTPNADWLWYAQVAPLLGIPTTHLSSDRFIGKYELIRLLEGEGFDMDHLGHWTFIPRGDMPLPWPWLLGPLDLPGRWLRIPRLRGGLLSRARRP
jgi:2-polyprenyl-6-hydroxyphenyl methylase/3-demethylubiquinone-9 3-methyltransferase